MVPVKPRGNTRGAEAVAEGKLSYSVDRSAAAAAVRLHDGGAAERLPPLHNVFGEFKANLLVMNSHV